MKTFECEGHLIVNILVHQYQCWTASIKLHLNEDVLNVRDILVLLTMMVDKSDKSFV